MAAKKKTPEPPKPWAFRAFTECFAFLPGARMLTGHALLNEIQEWDLATGLVTKTRRKGRKNKDGVNAIAVRPNGAEFLAQTQDDTIRLWALDAEKPIRELHEHQHPINCLQWLDAKRAISGGNDRKLRIWDIDTGSVLAAMDHGDHIVGLAVTPDGTQAWTGGWEKVRAIRRWDLERAKELEPVATLAKPASSMAVSPDGSRVAIVTYGGALHVFDFATGKEEGAALKAHDDRVDGVAWSKDGEHIVTVSEFDETLRLFGRDGSSKQVIRDLPRPARIAVGPDETLYVAIAYQRIDRFRIAGGALQPS